MRRDGFNHVFPIDKEKERKTHRCRKTQPERSPKPCKLAQEALGGGLLRDEMCGSKNTLLGEKPRMTLQHLSRYEGSTWENKGEGKAKGKRKGKGKEKAAGGRWEWKEEGTGMPPWCG